MSADERFVTKLAEITGAYRTPVTPAREEAPAAKIASIADMTLKDVMDHPSFEAGFNARMAERMPEIDAAFAQLPE